MKIKKFNHKFFKERVFLKTKIFKVTKKVVAEQLGVSLMRLYFFEYGLAKPNKLELQTMALYFQRNENDFLL